MCLFYRAQPSQSLLPYNYLFILEKIVRPEQSGSGREPIFIKDKDLSGLNTFDQNIGQFELFDLLEVGPTIYTSEPTVAGFRTWS